MKKTLLLGLALLGTASSLTSCSDQDSLPNVSYNIGIAGATVDNSTGTIYMVQGDTLKITSLSVTNLDSDKAAVINVAEYYWDYNFLGLSPFEPYAFKIYVPGNDTQLGAHQLSIRAVVLAVDKEPAVGIIEYPVMVVADSTQMPQVVPATSTLTGNIGLSEQ